MEYGLSTGINFISLLITLWLGLYLITRSPRSLAAGLMALTLWSMAGYFLNQFLALYPPSSPPDQVRTWLYRFMVFWPRNVFELGWRGWLQGWLPAYAIAFWYHTTLCLRPGQSTGAVLWKAGLGYIFAFAGILLKVRYSSGWAVLADGPLYNTGLRAPFFPLFLFAYLILTVLGLYNLMQTTRSTSAELPAVSLRQFVLATLFVYAAGGLEIAGWFGRIAVPQVATAVLLAAAVTLAGVSIARYNASLERRPFQPDFRYSAAGATALLMIYLSILWALSTVIMVPAAAFLGAGFLAVVTPSIIDLTRVRVDLHHFYIHRKPSVGTFPVPIPDCEEDHERVKLIEVDQQVEVSPRLVEMALRHLHDYRYLSELPLVNLHLVHQYLDGNDHDSHTHFQQGKALAEVLIRGVNTLKPEPVEPAGAPPRNWYPYLILRKAYLEDTPNQEIMSRLYISEGTFNRTRRAAIDTVTLLLKEMEEEILQQ